MFYVACTSVALAYVSWHLFKTNNDFKQTVCLYASMGYIDFLGSDFLESLSKCMADTADVYLERDFAPGSGKIIPTYEIGPENFTYALLKEETLNWTRPVIVRGLLLGSKCQNWDIDYFAKKAAEDEKFRLQVVGSVPGKRRAFIRHSYEQEILPAKETFDKIKAGDDVYISFDNYFVKNSGLVQEMNLDTLFPDISWVLHTLFISNFGESKLGSPFHADPNDNFLFQCRGRKHWFNINPHDLKYTSAYVSKGVTYSSNFVNETKIVDRLTIYEARLEEGDFMYNPPYWLHAVGMTSGLTISVANRVWQAFTPQNPNAFFDLIYKLNFPGFIGSIIYSRVFSGQGTASAISLQKYFQPKVELTGGVLSVMEGLTV